MVLISEFTEELTPGDPKQPWQKLSSEQSTSAGIKQGSHHVRMSQIHALGDQSYQRPHYLILACATPYLFPREHYGLRCAPPENGCLLKLITSIFNQVICLNRCSKQGNN